MGLRLPGNRIVKTAVAVFLTAYICVLLNWPPVFAVVTAIVTLEPTVSDSIKKGLVRFPASAIGSFYAVLFIALFGNSPITYTLAATLTIITCFQLRLHAGLLVAAITAVAMVEVVYDNYLLSFLTRLGTTTTGIVVSTLVNMFVFPPNYTKEIQRNITDTYQQLGNVLRRLARLESKTTLAIQMNRAKRKIEKTEELIRYQKDQSHFQAFVISGKEDFHVADKEVEQLRLVHYHLANITDLGIKHMTFSKENMQFIQTAILHLADIIQGKPVEEQQRNERKLRDLLDLFWTSQHPAYKENEAELPHELTLLYELITVYYLTNDLRQNDKEMLVEKKYK